MHIECSSAPSLNPAADWEKYNELCNILNSICEMEKNLVQSPNTSRAEAFKPFIEWLKSHGTQIGDVKLVELPLYGCCVQAVGTVAMGDLLFSIPQELMMTNETAKASRIGETIHYTVYIILYLYIYFFILFIHIILYYPLAFIYSISFVSSYRI